MTTTTTSKAIKKLRELVDKGESISSLAAKLGIARGTLLAVMAGTSEPRLGVILAAKKIGIKQDDWA